MWLIPSQLSAFVPASDGSTKPSGPDSGTLGCDIELRPTVSGKPTLKPSSWPAWKNRPWSQRLFGAAISRTSTANRFVDRWTESLRGSRASRGATPDSGREPTTTAGSGRLSLGSSLTWDRGSCSWKTSQLSLLGEELSTSSVTSPKWGSMRSGAVSRRPPLELRTGGSECSSWPTPDATAAQRGNGGYSERQLTRPEGKPSILNYDVLLWTTPMAADRANRGNRARKDPSNHVGGEANLADDAQHWQTPSSQSFSKRRQVGQESREELLLPAQAQQWGTPRANQHKGGGENTPVNGFLDRQAETFSLPAPEPTGEDSPKPSGRRLNPAFVCWLMGAPVFWTWPYPIFPTTSNCGERS